MNVYSIVLFIHIAAALGFFVVMGLEWIGLWKIRSASLPEEARAILGVVQSANRLGAVSMPTLILTGLYMLLTAWREAAWIYVVVGALALETVLFVALNVPRMAAIEQALATEKGALSPAFHNLVSHPILWISVQTRTAILLGIVFLKVAKPDLGGSLLAIGVAIVLGLASTLPVLRRERAQAGPAARILIAFLLTTFVAALVLLAANSIPARAIPPSKTQSDEQGSQTKPSEVPTEVSSSNLPTPAPTLSPETALQEGRLLLETRCTQCHALEKVQQAKQTRTGWEQTLAKMESFGVKIKDTEKEVLLDYLTAVDHP